MHKNSKSLEAIINTLKSERLRLKKTQIEIAVELGITQTYLSQLENHKKPRFSTALLTRYAETLGSNISLIMWKSLTEDNISDEKKDAFKLLKPRIDELIEQVLG